MKNFAVLGSHVRRAQVAIAVALVVAIGIAPLAFAQQGRRGDNNTIQRNLDELPRGNTPQNQGGLTEPINIDFVDVPLPDFVASMTTQLGINMRLPQNVPLQGQNVTIISTQALPAEQAMDLLESVLRSSGFVLVSTLDGNLYTIEQMQGGPTGGPSDKFPLFIDGNAAQVKGYDHVTTHVVRLKHSDPEEIADLLSQAKVNSAQANIIAFASTGMLVVTDTADGLRNMYTLIEAVDLPGYSTSVEMFMLEYSRAEAIVTQIEEVLQPEEGASGSRGSQVPQRSTPGTRRAAAATPGQPNSAVIGAAEAILRLVPDERLNAVIVVATAPLMDEVRFLIDQLDTPTPREGNPMHYVPLENADAEEVATALEAITSTQPRQGDEGGGLTSEVQPFEKSIVISVYEPTNSLLVLAASQDFKLLKSMIDHLDVPPRQVNIEAMIMQVQLTDGFELTVESALLNEDNAFGLVNATNIANALANGPASLAGPGGVLGILDGTTSIPDGVGGTITVPNIPLLIRAVEQLTDLEILSKPNLLTVDNEEASINVGDDVPLITSQGDVDDRTGFSSRSRVERRETGVTLTVTPQINEGDYVKMEVDVEVSQVVPAAENDTGIDPNDTGAIVSQSVVTNTVVVGDGQTGIIGGLIQSARNETESGVPVFQDLPLVGWLFRSTQKGRAKQNLVVLVTPYIIKKSEDLQRVTDYRVQEYYKERMDILFDDDAGFIEKVSTKFSERDKRPTDQYDPARGTSLGGLNRGNIDQ